MGVEINRLGSPNSKEYHRLSISLESPYGIENGRWDSNSSALHTNHATADQTSSSTGELAGVYLGILNLFTTLPQFLGTFISMIVFSALEPGKSPELATEAEPHEVHSTDGPNAIAVCLFIGAVSAVVAAYATRKLKYS
jgi:solute carrier family 45, member 1/2/4